MLPPGYERLLLPHAVAVARTEIAASLRRALVAANGSRMTVLEYAARHRDSRVLRGRGDAYAAPLPAPSENVRVVVRHNRHGGLLAPLTGDLFLPPTRAPHELETSVRLHELGVPTPEVLAFVVYPVRIVFRRVDVLSREIAGGRDFAEILTSASQADRVAAFAAATALVAVLSRAGARHQDLNAKNILMASGSAFVLDVDRVALGYPPDTALDRNLERLGRSLRKWRDRWHARISEQDILTFEAETRRAFAASARPPVENE